MQDPENKDVRAAYGSCLMRSYPKNIVESLLSSERWHENSHLEQDAVFAYLSHALQAHFQWRGAINTLIFRIGCFSHNKTGILLNLLPGGHFYMGSHIGASDERPVQKHQVTPFLIGRCPVTRSQWHKGQGRKTKAAPNLPHTDVSWYEARVWLTEVGGSLRLPSEREREYAAQTQPVDIAAKGRSTNGEYGGSNHDLEYQDFDPRYSWFQSNSQSRVHSVEEHRGLENEFGLIDMSGNVWEWCDDLYKNYRSGRPPPEDLPVRLYSLRGGSFRSDAAHCRSACRRAEHGRYRAEDLGLRVARDFPLAEILSIS
jgi:formylglycine-generating enzyme required for sulfatase activity